MNTTKNFKTENAVTRERKSMPKIKVLRNTVQQAVTGGGAQGTGMSIFNCTTEANMSVHCATK